MAEGVQLKFLMNPILEHKALHINGLWNLTK